MRNKSELKKELKINLSKAYISSDNLKEVKKAEREKFIEIKLLEVNLAALQWSIQNDILKEDELSNESFIAENPLLKDQIINGGLAISGLGGAGIVFSSVTAPVFLGFGGGIAAITAASAALIAAPVVTAGLVGLGIYKYKDNEAINKLLKYFDQEKDVIYDFYCSKIDTVKIE
ncbi:MAG: hypothetical protein PHO27_12305 [Sulfuricurvum sp.]|nr:hypothetical protein [Sulfuricurvum sp.]